MKAMQVGLQKRKSFIKEESLSESLTLEEQLPQGAAITQFTGVSPNVSVGHDTPTLASQPELGAPQTNLSSITEVRTHFKTIDESDRRRASAPITSATAEPEDHRGLWASIAGLVLLLVAMVSLGWWMTRLPSADQLYGEIIAARDAGSPEDAELQVKQFLYSYDKDDRVGDVQAVADGLNMELAIRRLEHQSRRAGGVERLSPPQMALMEALQLRHNQPELAIRRLQLWLNVFGAEDAPSAETNRLAKIAKSVLQDLQQSPEENEDNRRIELNRWLDWAEKNLEGDAYREFCSSVVELFSGKLWAKEALERVKQNR